MKQLEINNQEYLRLLKAFTRHLQTLNYSKDTVYNDTNMIKEYLHFLIEQQQPLNKTDSETVENYVNYLQTRSNQRRSGGLSVAYLRKHVSTLKRFYQYLHLSGYYSVTLEFPRLGRAKNVPSVLSVREIEQLFKSCDDDLLGKRNKAILAIYYGCGLRRKEGVSLNLEDVNLEREELFVSTSKTNKQRIVPMSPHVVGILEDYVYNVREKLVPEDKSTAALLITDKGKPLSAQAASKIFEKILTSSKIKTAGSLHTLRHSIATHLLQSGMKLESIALFLGHKSIDSTQIYTHLIHQKHDI